MKRAVVALILLGSCGACSGGSGASSVSRTVADAWPAKWCQAEPGVRTTELVALMGQPTSASATHMSWSAHQYQFNAFLDADGRAEQLDINLHSLSDAEKAALKCGAVRTRRSVEAAVAAATPSRTLSKACVLVSEAEMSAILGAPVVATANDRSNGKTECIYKAASGISPYVDLSIDWGDGKTAMAAAGLMGKYEPGLTNPYDGIGDQAAAVGPALMIRTGEDLMTIVFSGVSEAPAKAKKIFVTAKARM
jgi:hypothetical protein